MPGHYLDIRTSEQGSRTIEGTHLLGDRLPRSGAGRIAASRRSSSMSSSKSCSRGRAPAAGRRAGGVVSVGRRRFEPGRRAGLQGRAAARSRRSPSASTIRASTKPSEAGIVARHLGCTPTVANSAPRRCCKPIRELDPRRRRPGDRHVVRRPARCWRRRSTSTATRSP